MGLTQQEIADKVGRDRSSVANTLRLLKLPPDVQEKLAANKISMGHARALLALEDPDRQSSLAKQIVAKNLSVREVESLVQERKKRASPGKKTGFDADLQALEEELIRIIGTKVSISGNRQRGTVRIFYFSLDELNRIYDHIKGARS
jgi:ParB family chromosome partitioning protein